MSRKIVLTLEIADSTDAENLVNEFNNVIGENLKYMNSWEWIYE
jgi:hypothetical protein